MSRRTIVAKEPAPLSEHARFLKLLRQRIDPGVPNLGPHPRLPWRVGRRVTQQEVAEAVGISREWYATLESATSIEASNRPSHRVLERLAEVLMITPQQRATLFEMVVPPKWRIHPSDDAIAALEAFSRLRLLSRRLWSATSVEDALVIATESIAEWYDDHLFVLSTRRCEAGLWESQPVADKQEQSIVSTFLREFQERPPTSEAIDALNLYPQLRNPGDVGTDAFYPPALQQTIRERFDDAMSGFTFLKARIRTRTGLIAGVSVFNERGYSYSPSQRAALGALAEVTSLALL